MQKKFLQNLIVMVVLNLLIKPYSIFFIDAEVQNRVGTSEYGFYFTLLNFSYLFNILLDIGTTNYNVKNTSKIEFDEQSLAFRNTYSEDFVNQSPDDNKGLYPRKSTKSSPRSFVRFLAANSLLTYCVLST